MALDSRHFEYVSVEHGTQEHPWDYTVYRPLISTMVLYSKKEGIPIAAVGLRTHLGSAEALIAKRPGSVEISLADFQGIVNADNRRFEFVITNLTNYDDVKIDIMKQNTAVMETDPGPSRGALNNVNELHGYQSYVVQGDQKDSRTLILSSIRAESEPRATTTVQQAEKAATAGGGKAVGTYFYIAVTPKATVPGLVELFADTYWDTADFILLRQQMPPPGTIYGQVRRGGMVLCAEEVIVPYSRNEEPRRFNALQSILAEDDDDGESRMVARVATMPAASATLSLPPAGEGRSEGKYESMRYGAEGAEVEEVVSERQSRGPGPVRVIAEVIGGSLASNVESGEYIVTSGHKTGSTYRYNVPSNVDGKLCCLCLSVAPGLHYGTGLTSAEIGEAAKLQVADFRTSGVRALMREIKVYASEHCCICLDKGPSVLFYRCGHKCCCDDCNRELKTPKCPVCRAHIHARMQV